MILSISGDGLLSYQSLHFWWCDKLLCPAACPWCSHTHSSDNENLWHLMVDDVADIDNS